MKKLLSLLTIVACIIHVSCSDNNDSSNQTGLDFDFSSYFSIDFNNLPNYSDQYTPAYISKDNTAGNTISDRTATLGRILFYDKNLSSDNTISCSSCHKQADAFSDLNIASIGVNGSTGRHSMRLINSRFADETNFFWDERANTLEEQTTMPIQDHIEMGFSGTNGDLDFNGLIQKLEQVDYYPELFNFAFGDSSINETRIQNALAQFVRSIQSFDSKYDTGRLNSPNDVVPFTNFTTEENNGKQLFFGPPNFDNSGNRIGGGVGCAVCHRGPEFDITPNSQNNGIIGTLDNSGTDLTITRSPTLRDLFKLDGTLNGPLMHTGIPNMLTVINHYNTIPVDNPSLDNRLKPNGNLQRLNMTDTEKNELIAFLKTLSGTDVYTDERWSNPFID